MWKLNNRITNSKDSLPCAMRDKAGNMITSQNSLLALYKNEYMKRLSPKPPYPGYVKVKGLNELLFNLEYEISVLSKSLDWSQSDIIKICKKLKKRESPRFERIFVLNIQTRLRRK